LSELAASSAVFNAELGGGQRLLTLRLRLLNLRLNRGDSSQLGIHGGVRSVASRLTIGVIAQVAGGITADLGGVQVVVRLGKLLLLHRCSGG